MLHTRVPAAFQHVSEPDHIRLDVGEWVRQRVANSGLSGQVNDAVEVLFSRRVAPSAPGQPDLP